MTEPTGDPTPSQLPPSYGSTPPPTYGSTPPPPPPGAYPPGGYAQPGYAPTSGASNGIGTAALVLGIIALLSFWTLIGGILLGLLAVIFGVIGRKRAGRGEATNGGVALAGVILGVLGLLASIAIIAAGATIFEHHKKDFHNLQACVNAANGDQQKINSCDNQFRHAVTGN